MTDELLPYKRHMHCQKSGFCPVLKEVTVRLGHLWWPDFLIEKKIKVHDIGQVI